jgi:hypothetical protein
MVALVGSEEALMSAAQLALEALTALGEAQVSSNARHYYLSVAGELAVDLR